MKEQDEGIKGENIIPFPPIFLPPSLLENIAQVKTVRNDDLSLVCQTEGNIRTSFSVNKDKYFQFQTLACMLLLVHVF